MNPPDKLRWASPVPLPIGQRHLALYFNRFGLSAINQQDGSRVWNFPYASDSCSAAGDPLIVGLRVLFATRPLHRGDAATVLLDTAGDQPQVVWRTAAGVSNFQQRVIWEDHLYGCDAHTWTKGDATLKCLDLKDGRVLWSQPDYDWGEVVLVDGKLIIQRYGELSIVEATPKQFHLLAKATVVTTAKDMASATPVLANGLLYARGIQGDLICLDLRPGPK